MIFHASITLKQCVSPAWQVFGTFVLTGKCSSFKGIRNGSGYYLVLIRSHFRTVFTFEGYFLCRSVRMVGDTILTGSDDWTARVWSVSRGSCDAVLACHDGPVLSVEYSPSDKGIITG